MRKIITAIVLLFIAFKNNWFPQIIFNYKSISSLINFGFYHFANRVVAKMHTRGDQLIIGKLLGVFSLGLYNTPEEAAAVYFAARDRAMELCLGDLVIRTPESIVSYVKTGAW